VIIKICWRHSRKYEWIRSHFFRKHKRNNL